MLRDVLAILKKMIFFGSGAEYDKRFPILKVKESEFGQKIPVDDYGLYKFICSQFISDKEKFINLRLFGVFGKYEDYEIRFISQSICRNLSGIPITIKKNVYFDYLYVNDLVRIVDHFLTHKNKFSTYNTGRGEKIDLLTIAKIINKVSKNPVPIIIKNKGFQNEYTCNITRLKKEISGLQFSQLEDSIRELYKWYSKNWHVVNKKLL